MNAVLGWTHPLTAACISDMGTVLRRWCASKFAVISTSDDVASVDSIIFLAPISGFDQVLAEDRSVNRLVGVLAGVRMMD
jgi:hypothetical protein